MDADEFNDALRHKTKLLMALESLPPAPATIIMTMALSDVLLVTSASKQSALELVDAISSQLKENIEYADKNGIGNWNNKTIQ
jgi:dihydropteroate synthase